MNWIDGGSQGYGHTGRMKIRWSGCLVSVLGLLLLIPLVYYGGFLLFAISFNDNGSQDGLDFFHRGELYIKLGLGLAALLFFGGVYWMFSAGPPEPEDESIDRKEIDRKEPE